MSPNRRRFLQGVAATGGALAFSGPLQAFAFRTAAGAPARAGGYGPLRDMGALSLPRGFRYQIISRSGQPMSDGNRTPTSCDGMAAFPGDGDTTVLVRNHENRQSTGDTGEIPVVVPADKRYDADPVFNAGCSKLVVTPDRDVTAEFAVLGGTSTNCAGGPMPWGSWLTCEEVFQDGERHHGYAFEIDARTGGPVEPVPIRSAGRFVHEAVAWHRGVLYETEDQRGDAAFYRYIPSRTPRRPGDLARTPGTLQALKIRGMPGADTNTGFPVGERFPVEWVTIEEPDPGTDTVRDEAHSKGAAFFNREEGAWQGSGRIYFDCTEGGGTPGSGQIWEFDPLAQTVTLIYQSPGAHELHHPDNLTVAPTRDLFICEDADAPQYVRGLTPDGRIYDFARANTNTTEFAGATFSPDGRTFFVNQFGDGEPGATYAIWGPWQRRQA